MMRTIAAALVLTAVLSTSRLAAQQTAYFYGEMITTSPDGSRPSGPPTPSLVKRTTDPTTGRITEAVLQKGQMYVTVMQREGDGNTFATTVNDSSFTGTLQYAGPEWAWTSWHYNIVMANGSGRIEGDGHLSASGIATEKYFEGPDGSRRARIVDALRPISAAEYQTRLTAMSKPDSTGS